MVSGAVQKAYQNHLEFIDFEISEPSKPYQPHLDSTYFAKALVFRPFQTLSGPFGFEDKKTLVYRVGGITIEKLESIIGEVEIFKKNTKLPISSGMLKNHYSPKKDLIVGEIQSLIKKYINKKIGILSFNKYYKGIDLKNQIILSKNLNLDQASRNLYKSLHLLDNMNIDIILTSLLPNHGIGKSINDRIIKASKKNEL